MPAGNHEKGCAKEGLRAFCLKQISLKELMHFCALDNRYQATCALEHPCLSSLNHGGLTCHPSRLLGTRVVLVSVTVQKSRDDFSFPEVPLSVEFPKIWS